MNQFRDTEIERRVLDPEAVAFLTDLEQEFGWQRGQLLAERQTRQGKLDDGEQPGFLNETRQVRESDWAIDPVPAMTPSPHTMRWQLAVHVALAGGSHCSPAPDCPTRMRMR